MTRPSSRWLVPLAAVALMLALGIAHLASSNPDGLERVAEQQKFAQNEKVTAAAPMPDYEVSALRRVMGRPLARTLAGLAGVLLTFGLVLGVGRLVARRRGPFGDDADDNADDDADGDTSGPNV